MTPQIKQRIEQIRRGEVPDGYKKTKLGVVPNEWEDTLFSDLFTSTSDYTDDLDRYPLYSLTIEDGITAKTERYERSHLVKKENAYKIVRPNDFAYNPMNVRFGAVARHKGNSEVSISGYYDIFTTKVASDLEFMDSFLISDKMITYYNKVSIGSLVEKQRVHFTQFMDFRLPLPSESERKKIAEILSKQEKLIELKEKLIEEKKRQKKALIKQILNDKAIKSKFSAHWETVELKDVFDYIQPTKYLVESTDYSDDYETPVLTAGKSFILGYTNEIHGIFDQVPAVIFDDFTTDSKYVDFPFKAKSSAMKILMVKDGFDIQFAFELLQNIDYNVGGHERHWISVFSQMTVGVPPYEVQQKIGQIIQCVNNEIDLLQKDLDQEKQKKKALMQLLLKGIVRV